MALIDIHQYRLPPEKDRALGFIQQFMDMVVGNLARMRDLGTIDGQVLKKIGMPVGTQRIPHKLGRVPTGFIVTDINAAATISRSAWDSSSITLASTGFCTINVWVF